MTVFGYQNKNKNRRVVVDSSDQILVGGINELDKDYNNIFLQLYPYAVEEIYTKIPDQNIDALDITAFVDSAHTHEK